MIESKENGCATTEKIYIKGKLHNIAVGMRKINLTDTVTINSKGEKIYKKNAPVIVYDTGGVHTDENISININSDITLLQNS